MNAKQEKDPPKWVYTHCGYTEVWRHCHMSKVATNIMKNTDKKYVDVTKVSLEEWLALLNSPQKEDLLLIDYMFPTDALRDEYIATIHNRSDDEVINLLRRFLIYSGSLGKDKFMLDFLMHCMKHDKEHFNKLMKHEYFKRLLNGYFNKKVIVWEGNTWIIDLLPHDPKIALDALYAYFLAHIQLLPDGRLSGLDEAMALIRAKFINVSHPSSLLLELDPYQFEHLIDALYSEMGYDTILTQKTHDGGRDVIAEKKGICESEKLLVQCKRQKKNVGVTEIRALLGIVSNEKATKGVLVTTSEFTAPAKKFANENARLELVGQKDLQQLLNKFFGSKWPTHLDFIISNSLSRNRK